MTDNTFFELMAASFIDQSELDHSGKTRDEMWEEQYMIIKEEFEELGQVLETMRHLNDSDVVDHAERVEELEGDAAEELADLCITTFTAAEVMGMDMRKAFSKKMEYNLTKSGGEVEDGKIQDDTDREKPDFGDVFHDKD